MFGSRGEKGTYKEAQCSGRVGLLAMSMWLGIGGWDSWPG